MIPGTTYYWRPISQASPEVIGDEMSFSTPVQSQEETNPGTGGGTEEENQEEEGPFVEIPSEEEIVFEEPEEEPQENQGFLAWISSGLASIVDALRSALGGISSTIFLWIIIILIIVLTLLILLYLLCRRKKESKTEKEKPIGGGSTDSFRY